MKETVITLALGILSCIVAFASFTWSIFKDIFLRPRLRIRGSVSGCIENGTVTDDFLSIKIYNYGPGEITINSLVVKVRCQHSTKTNWLTIVDGVYKNPLNKGLPMAIQHGNANAVLLELRKAVWLKEHIYKIGVGDNFGKHYWMPSNDVRKICGHYSGLQKKNNGSSD